MNELIASNLAKSYGKRQILRDISFRVPVGKVVGLLGPNGSGKTTAFYILIGLIRPDKGKIYLNDRDITSLSLHKRGHLGLGYLPQGGSVFQDLTVEDNIRAALEFRSDLTRVGQRAEMERLLQIFSLKPIRAAKGRVLSGGERRRTEMARLLATKPQFALMDEPFAGVDPISVHEIKKLARALVDLEIGVLINDHNVGDILSLCDENYVIGEGRIIARGDAESIVRNQQVRSTYLGEDYKLNQTSVTS